MPDPDPPTPHIVIDLDVVRKRYAALQLLFPAASIYYAVKANPAAPVIAALATLGAKFDIASEGELKRCRDAGVRAEHLSFGNTIKREREIADAAQSGIDLFAFDSRAELDKLARSAPGARVFCRLLIENRGAEWPLSRKFGCEAHIAADLLIEARARGLRPTGVSFHVGSQQTDPGQWPKAIAHAAWVFRACAHRGLDLELLNLGGGLPAHYRAAVPPLESYAEAIEAGLADEFGSNRPHLIIEPGRYLVGDAGTLRSEILLISRKSRRERERWVYLDAGRYNGLPETEDERIHYRIRTPSDGNACGPVILAGPTCDSNDILYRRQPYELPLDLQVGDRIEFLSAGAYTASYAAVEFNGFAPIRTYCV
ncbi:MAG TPA: type III PLP-dependent enzyme [Stellaceae bacterium]|nr:type III PLP-dependent enzyme [Stellaceae bacterium]